MSQTILMEVILITAIPLIKTNINTFSTNNFKLQKYTYIYIYIKSNIILYKSANIHYTFIIIIYLDIYLLSYLKSYFI